MPDGQLYNIWDLSPTEATDNVLKAIAAAFTRGVEALERLQRTKVVLAPKIKKGEQNATAICSIR
jgi:hypothetical protein